MGAVLNAQHQFRSRTARITSNPEACRCTHVAVPVVRYSHKELSYTRSRHAACVLQSLLRVVGVEVSPLCRQRSAPPPGEGTGAGETSGAGAGLAGSTHTSPFQPMPPGRGTLMVHRHSLKMEPVLVVQPATPPPGKNRGPEQVASMPVGSLHEAWSLHEHAWSLHGGANWRLHAWGVVVAGKEGVVVVCRRGEWYAKCCSWMGPARAKGVHKGRKG